MLHMQAALGSLLSHPLDAPDYFYLMRLCSHAQPTGSNRQAQAPVIDVQLPLFVANVQSILTAIPIETRAQAALRWVGDAASSASSFHMACMLFWQCLWQCCTKSLHLLVLYVCPVCTWDTKCSNTRRLCQRGLLLLLLLLQVWLIRACTPVL
jgi:hypothetical protein